MRWFGTRHACKPSKSRKPGLAQDDVNSPYNKWHVRSIQFIPVDDKLSPDGEGVVGDLEVDVPAIVRRY